MRKGNNPPSLSLAVGTGGIECRDQPHLDFSILFGESAPVQADWPRLTDCVEKPLTTSSDYPILSPDGPQNA